MVQPELRNNVHNVELLVNFVLSGIVAESVKLVLLCLEKEAAKPCEVVWSFIILTIIQSTFNVVPKTLLVSRPRNFSFAEVKVISSLVHEVFRLLIFALVEQEGHHAENEHVTDHRSNYTARN